MDVLDHGVAKEKCTEQEIALLAYCQGQESKLMHKRDMVFVKRLLLYVEIKQT